MRWIAFGAIGALAIVFIAPMFKWASTKIMRVLKKTDDALEESLKEEEDPPSSARDSE